MFQSQRFALIGLDSDSNSIAELHLAGLGVLGVPGLASVWRWAAVIGSLASVSLIVIYWSVYFIVGLALDVLILAAALAGWPQD